jgi:hypothetical protein
MTCVHLFTDGRGRGNPGPGDWAFLLRDIDAQGHGHERVGSGTGPTPPTTAWGSYLIACIYLICQAIDRSYGRRRRCSPPRP